MQRRSVLLYRSRTKAHCTGSGVVNVFSLSHLCISISPISLLSRLKLGRVVHNVVEGIANMKSDDHNIAFLSYILTKRCPDITRKVKKKLGSHVQKH